MGDDYSSSRKGPRRRSSFRTYRAKLSSYYADVSLDQWMALTPPEPVEAHLKLDPEVMKALRRAKVPIVPA